MNKYLIAFTRYKHIFSIEVEIDTYCVEAETMKEAVNQTIQANNIHEIIAISKLDESISWGDLR